MRADLANTARHGLHVGLGDKRCTAARCAATAAANCANARKKLGVDLPPTEEAAEKAHMIVHEAWNVSAAGPL